MNFKKIFQEHYLSVKHFGNKPGLIFCRFGDGSKLFAKVSEGDKRGRKELINLLHFHCDCRPLGHLILHFGSPCTWNSLILVHIICMDIKSNLFEKNLQGEYSKI